MNNDFPTSIDYNDWVINGCRNAITIIETKSFDEAETTVVK